MKRLVGFYVIFGIVMLHWKFDRQIPIAYSHAKTREFWIVSTNNDFLQGKRYSYSHAKTREFWETRHEDSPRNQRVKKATQIF